MLKIITKLLCIISMLRGGSFMHEGHRERLRKKFLKDNLNGLEKHELLEMILFYAIPRKNTNEISHLLINKFGSISGVIEASIEDLEKVDGMGINSAILIKSYLAVIKVCMEEWEEQKERKSKKLNFKDICNILRIKFLGKNKENLVLILMNEKSELIFLDIIREGNINGIDIYLSEIVQIALKYKSSYVIISHNHPSGKPLPSKEDIETTKTLINALKLVNIKLLDHIIVSGHVYTSLANTNLGKDIFEN